MRPDVHTLAGPYALDALEDAERGRFEAHLARCADCAREITGLRATAARLGAAVADEPPERLRALVLDRVVRIQQDGPVRATRSAAAGPSGARAWRPLAAAATLVVALGLGVLDWHTRTELDTARDLLTATQAQYAELAALLAAPDAHTTTAAGDGGSATVLQSRARDGAVLVANLPRPPEERVYQAWLIGDGLPRSAGLLRIDEHGTGVPLVFSGLDGARTIGVTVEPAGGSVQPTTVPVLLVALSS